jgi:hypothetical protein
LAEDAARDALRSATRLHLVRQAGIERFGWHDLIHEYLTQRLAEEESDESRHVGLCRMLDHYLGSPVAVAAAEVAGAYVPRPPLGASAASLTRGGSPIRPRLRRGSTANGRTSPW